MNLLQATRDLAVHADGLRFSEPVHTVYNPLQYARAGHEMYLRRFASGRKRVLLLGMNPGPYGMAQTGVPFGEVNRVRDWMGIQVHIEKPEREHPKRPVQGFDCPRSEVSGRRLWGLFAEQFDSPTTFFSDHLVMNYCPLVFMAESGRNIPPDKLPVRESAPLFEACNAYLTQVIRLTQPAFLIGVGRFAEERLAKVERPAGAILGRILHPSPASPAANRDWAGTATRQLRDLGAWAN